MKNILSIFAIVLLAPLAQSASTSDGCGLGWQVNDSKSMIGTTTRGTTNLTVPPTFGMTSGTIGCKQHAIAANDINKATYAVTNFETLKVEMAIGQGDTLEGFAQLMGCQSNQFGELTKENYNQIYQQPETSALEMFDAVKSLAVTCNPA